MCLSTPSSTVKEKYLSFVIVHRVQDLVKCLLLFLIEVGIAIIDHVSHEAWVISELFLEDGVGDQDVPLLLWKRHVGIVVKTLSRVNEDVLEEVKAIVKYIFLCAIETPFSNELVSQVITYFDLVQIPKDVRLCRTTVQEDDGKETTKLMSCLHISCLLKTFFPLPIIFQKTAGETGSFEGRMQLTFKPPKILQRFCTFNIDQEHPEIKALSSRRMDKVHPADDLTLTTWLPLPGLFVPNKALGKVKIRDLLGT